jgi:hypothetical protein
LRRLSLLVLLFLGVGCGPQFSTSGDAAPVDGGGGMGGAGGQGGSVVFDASAGGGGGAANLDAPVPADAESTADATQPAPDASSPGIEGGPVSPEVSAPVDARGDQAGEGPVSLDASVPADAQVSADVAREASSGAKEILLVASATLSSGAAKLKGRLEGRGFVVMHVGAPSAKTEQAQGKALVMVISDAAAVNITTKFRDVGVPVMVMHPDLFQHMSMGPAGQGVAETNLTITSVDHPVAAGLSGVVTVATAGSMIASTPPSTAVTVATAGSSAQAALYVYPKDAMMVDRKAPAKRIAFFAGTGMLNDLSADGLKLLDAAVDWAIEP